MKAKKPRDREHEICFYCSALITEGTGKGDHFPLPKSVGGEITVPCCKVCHDMKDRFILEDWPAEWIEVILGEIPKLRRETRLFLAKCISVYARRDAAKM